MTFSSTRRFCGGALVVVALICLSSCAVPLAPGYQIEKQSITVRFVPGNPPHLAIRAQYRLANVGNAPLDFIELGLPGKKHFGLANLRVKIDGREVTPQRERSQASAPAEGESAVSEVWPETWRIPFESRWSRRQRKTLVIAYDLAATPATDPRISIASNAFYLNDSGWFPDPISTKALFAKDVVRPDPSNLIVDVPANFLATASGEPRGTRKAGDQTEFRFRLHKDDFDPYVVAGQYQQQTITTGDGTVVIWTFKTVPAAQAQQTGAQIAAAAKFYAQTFGPLPKSIRAIYDVQVPEDAPTYASLEAAEGAFLPGVVYDWVLAPGKSLWSGIGNAMVNVAGHIALGNTWFGHMIVPRAEAWTLRDSLINYAGDLRDEGGNAGTSRDGEIVSTLKDYDDERAKAVEKPIAFVAPGDPEDQQEIGGDKSILFFFALEDKCRRKNVEHAIAHMVYALRGQEYGYNDFRAALEQECHQDLSSVFATWLDQKGIPADFRARYQNGNEGKK
ncbi:MAG TPA: hypothetical protein VMV59_09120 [Candidatus Dormibacteraeota bacterium]|nr:hypothetical protein [Candidatus Dormibacteraeota bacterium]